MSNILKISLLSYLVSVRDKLKRDPERSWWLPIDLNISICIQQLRKGTVISFKIEKFTTLRRDHFKIRTESIENVSCCNKVTYS